MSYFRRPSDPHANTAFFPTFLAPSLPFRRKSRHGSNDSTSSTSSTSTTFSGLSEASSTTTASTSSNPFSSSTTTLPASTAPIVAPTSQLLSGHSSRLHCAKCSTDLCLTSQIISKGFTGRHGRAYLVQGSPSHVNITSDDASLLNTYQNKAVPRNLVTGSTLSRIFRVRFVGLCWKYVEAREESQKYKVGKFILETRRIRVGVSWENDDIPEDPVSHPSAFPPSHLTPSPTSQKEIEFDSQDEDECEDLFAGVWSPRLAEKRRGRRMRFESYGNSKSWGRGFVEAESSSASGSASGSGSGSGRARTRSEDTFS